MGGAFIQESADEIIAFLESPADAHGFAKKLAASHKNTNDRRTHDYRKIAGVLFLRGNISYRYVCYLQKPLLLSVILT